MAKKLPTTQPTEAKEPLTFPFRFLVPVLKIPWLILKNTEKKLDLHFETNCAPQRFWK